MIMIMMINMIIHIFKIDMIINKYKHIPLQANVAAVCRW